MLLHQGRGGGGRRGGRGFRLGDGGGGGLLLRLALLALLPLQEPTGGVVRAGRRHLPRLNLVASAPWGEDSEAARTMVRDWAMLGTCKVSQLPPITPSSFSELWETERLEEDCDSSLLNLPSVRPSLGGNS